MASAALKKIYKCLINVHIQFSSTSFFQDQVIKDVDKRVYQYLQTRCQLLLKSYPTTLEEDSAELHEAGKDDLSQKKYLCLVLRSKEKKMLHGAVKYCEKQTST